MLVALAQRPGEAERGHDGDQGNLPQQDVHSRRFSHGKRTAIGAWAQYVPAVDSIQLPGKGCMVAARGLEVPPAQKQETKRAGESQQRTSNPEDWPDAHRVDEHSPKRQ